MASLFCARHSTKHLYSFICKLPQLESDCTTSYLCCDFMQVT